MPKQVDHEERRRRIADAVCGLIDERGLEAATLRDVAARAEVSMGAVQRCFRTKDEMLRFALRHIGDRIADRVRARLLAGPAQSAASALGHAATELALLRAEHRAEARIWLAFVARAAVDPGLAELLRAGYAEPEDLLVRLLAEAGAPGARREARTLLALADGLTAHVLLGRLDAEEAGELLHAHLAALWARTA
ncbi:TetR/AcrR family transcriptional regulator [Streptomyces rubellomurinus]|uniref:TetR family transcriptional regulator n=1 Tax=Streptomyces rubellomurinus (strain ATCC 31215) TaxID=359131 RepID=A0A0F2TLC8_STRR3|nr:TetR family transcriptional regulator C-terminal domain-containing protein [Streptomyces rubellomurinus]KJS63085.1 TetR family transcriptional regulator [Streptomyces rubellomurinus]